MNGVLFTLIFAVVLAAAIYSRLPLTIICMTSMVAFMTALTPHGEPMNTILQIVRIPAAVVADFGTAVFGISAPYSAAILLMGTLLVDIGLTNMLGLRR
jgi:hypothetical protein